MSAGPHGNTASPVDCSVCNHSGEYTQCPGCGGKIGMGAWPPCTYCRAVVGTDNPPQPFPPLVGFAQDVPTTTSTSDPVVLSAEFFANTEDSLPSSVEYVTRTEYEAAIGTLRHELASLSAAYQRDRDALSQAQMARLNAEWNNC